jgi:hypothetical protein
MIVARALSMVLWWEGGVTDAALFAFAVSAAAAGEEAPE